MGSAAVGRHASVSLFNLLLLVALGASVDGGPAVAEPAGVALELDTPVAGASFTSTTPWIEMSGRAGKVPFFASDIVLAIDQSSDAFLASGMDVDRDGVVGRVRSWADERGRFAKSIRRWTTDADDTLLALELAIAADLTHGLGNRLNRIGTLAYSERPWPREPVGPPRSARASLERIPRKESPARIDIASALESAQAALQAAPLVAGPRRPRAVVLFSVGIPKVPDGAHWAKKRALETARALGEAGTQVWGIPFGRADGEYLAELGRASGGGVLQVEELVALSTEPTTTDFAPRELTIENRTTGRQARAVRIFPDGRFDAFAPVAEGENTLEVRAVLADGREARIRRVVHFDTPQPESTEARLEAARIMVELRRRTGEIDHSERLP